MYEDLINKLRYCGNAVSCLHCPYWEGCGGSKEDLMQAADAIEELQQIAAHYEEAAHDYFKDVCYYLERVPKWIPVTERLPEEKDSGFSADVLILVKEQDGDFTWEDVYSGYYLYDAVSNETGWWAQMPQNCQQVKERFSVTHWMPLPSTEGLNET